MNRLDGIILELIQEDFPISPTPYADLAKSLDSSEEEIIESIARLKKSGVIRRIGATIDSGHAGYISTLVACKVESLSLEEVAGEIGKHFGVTHSYERDSDYNLWFTLISRDRESMAESLESFSSLPGMIELHSIPATKVFKIRVKFGI